MRILCVGGRGGGGVQVQAPGLRMRIDTNTLKKNVKRHFKIITVSDNFVLVFNYENFPVPAMN